MYGNGGGRLARPPVPPMRPPGQFDEAVLLDSSLPAAGELVFTGLAALQPRQFRQLRCEMRRRPLERSRGPNAATSAWNDPAGPMQPHPPHIAASFSLLPIVMPSSAPESKVLLARAAACLA
jgi:hypothetical protein